MGILSSIGDFLGFGATLGSITDIGGTAGDDYLLGTGSGERIDGYGGNDWLKGNGGADTVFGGDGNDLIEGGSGNDYIHGGAGNDTASYFNANHGVIANLEFGTASTFGAGPVDDDTLVDIENLTGSFYDDSLQGNELANRIDAVAGNDVVIGWGGNDTIIGGFGNDFLVGADGNDTISGGFNNDTLQGNAGIDTVDYSYAYEGMTISLAQGAAHVRVPSSTVDNDTLNGIENVIGSQYNDEIEGNSAINTINGGTGNDTVSYRNSGNAVQLNLSVGWGQIGDAFHDTYIAIENITGSNHFSGDSLTGDDNINIIQGLNGNDALYGLGGGDTLLGGNGIDFIDGGEGNDLINGGEGGDIINGGAGIDTADFNPSFGGIGPEGPGVNVDLLAKTVSGLGNDGETIANVEIVKGTSFDDFIAGDNLGNLIYGGVNQDRLVGRGGNDLLLGETGNDSLNGGDGQDLLIGGLGRDALAGGLGNDFFRFDAVAEISDMAASRDVIHDFASGADRIGLANIDANVMFTSNQAFSFLGDAAFTGSAGELRFGFIGTNTIVEGDVTGDGAADFQLVLTGNVALLATDFVL